MDAARHFGLTRDPFAPTVDATAVFESQAFVAAREQLLRELRHGARLVALVGAAGTGKTLLLQAVEAQLAGEGRRIRRIDRGDLIDAAAPADLLLIDEADRMDNAALVALAKAAADPSRPAAVLALTHRRLDHLDLAVAPRFVELDELATSDARDFVIDRVQRAGGDPALFSPGALGAITYAAGGSPRLLRLLSSGAMFQAAQDGASRVEMGHARRAIAMQRGRLVEPPAEAEDEAMKAAAESVPRPKPKPIPVAVSPRAERQRTSPTEPQPKIASSVASSVIAVPPIVAPAVAVPPPAAKPEPIAAPPAPVAVAIEAVPSTPLELTDEAEVVERQGLRKRHLVAAGVVAALLAVGSAMLWPTGRPTAVSPPPAPTVASAASPSAPPVTPVADAPVVAPPAPEPEPASVAAAAAVEPPTPTPAPAATPAVAAEPPAPEPPPRVVIRYAGSQPGAADAAGRIADLLRARGFDVADVRAAPGRIREASTRYAPGQRAAGETLNSAFETVLRAYQPGAESQTAPSADGDSARGVIELWVPDSAAGASRPLRTDLPPS